MTETRNEVDASSEERRRLHDKYTKELFTRQLSNSENFDRSILSLSSAILAVSVAFIRSTGQSTQHCVWALWGSWVALVLAIAFTVVSFMTSQAAIDRQLQFAYEYYFERQNDALRKPNAYRKITVRLNRSAGIVFIAGIVMTMIFVIANLP